MIARNTNRGRRRPVPPEVPASAREKYDLEHLEHVRPGVLGSDRDAASRARVQGALIILAASILESSGALSIYRADWVRRCVVDFKRRV